MSGNFKKEDLRVIKTQKAFQNAIATLLERRKFKHITVNDLCEEALTSRAAFYTHYKDKYDLLEHWFSCILNELKVAGMTNVIDCLIYNNTKMMQNILSGADDETIKIVVNGLVFSLLDTYKSFPDNSKSTPEYTVLSNFCMGGFFEMVKWQSEQKYSKEFQETQTYFYDLLKTILDFHINYTK